MDEVKAIGRQKPLRARRKGWRLGPRVRTILLHATLVFFMLVIILPLVWVLLLSIRSRPDAYQPHILPHEFDFSHYGYVLSNIPTLPRNMLNSIVVTFATVIITTFCAILGGYALVHLDTPGRALLVGLLTATLFFPIRVVSLIAIFEIQRKLGLINTTLGLVLPYTTLNLALSVLIMRGIFEQISSELVDAAKIDGCGTWGTLVKVLFPLTVNGIVVVLIVNFVTIWGEYLLAATLTTDQEVRTIPVVLASAFGGMGQWAWPRIAAIYVMVVTPGILAFAFAQRWYIKGLQEGALKF